MNNQEQIDYWNGESGQRWAEQDRVMARLLQPIGDALLDHAELDQCLHVVDVGCGGGSQSRLLAKRLSSDATVTGIDISEPLLAVAQANNQATENAANIEYLLADAAEYDFPTGKFDGLFSRFGVMFFSDPVAAFTNLRKALCDGGKLAFSCWQGIDKNDWARIPVETAMQYVSLPDNMVPDAEGPGPFAFARAERIESILQQAGFSNIQITSRIQQIRIGEAPTLPESIREMAGAGPVQRLLVGQDDSVKEKVYKALESTMAPYYQNGAITLPSAIWFVTARALD